MESYHDGQHQMAAAAAAWGEPERSQLSIMSDCSSLFSISALRDVGVDDLAHSLPATPVSFGGEVEVLDVARQACGDDGDDRRTVRMMRNRESALRSRARKRAYVEELEKEVRRLVDDNLKLKKQCKELKQEVAALVLPTRSSMRRISSAQF